MLTLDFTSRERDMSIFIWNETTLQNNLLSDKYFSNMVNVHTIWLFILFEGVFKDVVLLYVGWTRRLWFYDFMLFLAGNQLYEL